jgi:hypothetical protein
MNLHRLNEYRRFDSLIVLFASSRDELVTAAPQYEAAILDEIGPLDRHRPAWLALDEDMPDGLPVVGLEVRAGAPAWFAVFAHNPQLNQHQQR